MGVGSVRAVGGLKEGVCEALKWSGGETSPARWTGGSSCAALAAWRGKEDREIGTSQYINIAVRDLVKKCGGSCLLWWLNKDFSHQMQMLGIQAQFWKVKQTPLNIGLFAWTKENVNMVNRRFELFYILLQQAPGLQEWNNISVLLRKFCQRKRIFLYPLKRRPRFKSPRLPLSLVTTVIAPWKRVFSHRPSCGTAKRLSKLRKSPSGTIRSSWVWLQSTA